MIQISSKDTLYMYNLYHIVKAFFPNEEISQNLDEKQESLVSVKLEENCRLSGPPGWKEEGDKDCL
mgnify:CR=1 FL=1